MMSDVAVLIEASFAATLVAVLCSAVCGRWFSLGEVSRAGRYQTLDGLRGLLALLVFFHHAAITWYYLGHGRWEAPESKVLQNFGVIGVALFFMITSFLFFGRIVNSRGRISWRDLYVRRLARLAPLYLFVVALLVLSVFYKTGLVLLEPLSGFIKNVFKWAIFSILGGADLNGVSETSTHLASVTWTLRYEWFFYLSLPLVACIVSVLKLRWQLILLVAGLLVGAVFAEHFLAANLWGKLYPLAIFIGGCVAVYSVKSERLRQFASSWQGSAVALSWLVFALLFCSSASVATIVVLTIAFVLIVNGADMFGFLRWSSVLWLGEVSYSVYLLHGLLLWLVFRSGVLGGTGRSVVIYSGCFVVSTVALVFLASLSFVLIEKPGIRLGGVLCRWLNRNQTEITEAIPERG